ncbi:MAG: YidC/Oxa1 family membrane protein insertase [Clostridia bacterium]|nr:YidC/Oxa1 family membrane protein insertase [Clostridia bacterium]
MDVISGLISAGAVASGIAKLIYNHLYAWVYTWSDHWDLVGAFSVTVIMFTIFLKVIVAPLDIWQKAAMRKNSKKMKEMRPELEKLKEQCGSNQQLYAQKQREVFKKHKYSMFGSCIPMIVTMVVFFIVFAGYNEACNMHTRAIYTALETEYETTYNAEIEALKNSGITDDTELKTKADEKAATAVLEIYENQYQEKFFWVKNIFVGDTWKTTVQSAGDASKSISGLDTAKYRIVMRKLTDKYTGWNGYLILPILVLILNLVSMLLNKGQMKDQQNAMPGQSEEQAKSAQMSSKIMQFVMPIMMFVFALFYSAAFTLYMAVNMFLTIVINLSYNLIVLRKDKIEEERLLATTYVRNNNKKKNIPANNNNNNKNKNKNKFNVPKDLK